jgi:hypothetical protein
MTCKVDEFISGTSREYRVHPESYGWITEIGTRENRKILNLLDRCPGLKEVAKSKSEGIEELRAKAYHHIFDGKQDYVKEYLPNYGCTVDGMSLSGISAWNGMLANNHSLQPYRSL